MSSGNFVACHGCGNVVDYDLLPTNSIKTSIPGRHCPTCNAPLDGMALHHVAPATGNRALDTEVKNSLRARVVAFHDAHGLTFSEPSVNADAQVNAGAPVDMALVEQLAASLAKRMVSSQGAEQLAAIKKATDDQVAAIKAASDEAMAAIRDAKGVQ